MLYLLFFRGAGPRQVISDPILTFAIRSLGMLFFVSPALRAITSSYALVILQRVQKGSSFAETYAEPSSPSLASLNCMIEHETDLPPRYTWTVAILRTHRTGALFRKVYLNIDPFREQSAATTHLHVSRIASYGPAAYARSHSDTSRRLSLRRL